MNKLDKMTVDGLMDVIECLRKAVEIMEKCGAFAAKERDAIDMFQVELDARRASAPIGWDVVDTSVEE